MIRAATMVLLLAAALCGPATASDKKAAPKLTQEAKDGAQITQENIVKMKLKAAQPVQPNPPPPPTVGGPMPPPNP